MSDNTPLVEAPKSRTPLIVGGVVAVVVIALVVFFLTRGDDDSDLEQVTIGVVGASDPYWETFKDEAQAEGIELEVRDFADYTQANPALSEGEIDINQFQHLVYLGDYNVANDEDLTPIGSTAIYPLALYSTKVDSVEEIEDGETVVVPDDDSNQARALNILQSAGLITLSDGGSTFSDLADIDEAQSRVEVQAIKADLTPTSLPDVAAAVINNDYVEDAGLEFGDALAQDDPSNPNALAYVNVFAVRAEDKDNETYTKLVEIFQNSQEILDGVNEVSGDTAIFEEVSPSELQTLLGEVETDTREQN